MTLAPAWFFRESLLDLSHTLHLLDCDVGLVQKNSLEEDPEKTLERLATLYPLESQLVAQTAEKLARCSLVLCDISVLGIAAASLAGIPSVLVENFTWDWIYQQYQDRLPGFTPWIDYLAELYHQADHHLQAEPVCRPRADALRLPPVARPARQDPALTRQLLRVGEGDQLVLVTMGGLQGPELPLAAMRERRQCFILPGRAWGHGVEVQDNLRLLPASGAGIYHPDIVVACDAVIGKIGYSTLAEVYQAGVPYGYIRRPMFRESAPLAAFIDQEMQGMEISLQSFVDNSWLEQVDELCSLGRMVGRRENGAETAARFLAELIGAGDAPGDRP